MGVRIVLKISLFDIICIANGSKREHDAFLKHTGYIHFKITGQNMVYLESKGLFIFYSKKDKSFGMQKSDANYE